MSQPFHTHYYIQQYTALFVHHFMVHVFIRTRITMSFNVPVDHQCTSSKAVDSDVHSVVDRLCAFISSETVSEGLDG